MNKNIILTGFMGSGKTTCGQLLAQMLNYDFIDIDSYIETNESDSIIHIFEEYGEDYFRQLETNACQNFKNIKCHVISTGGGTVKKSLNMKLLSKNGIVFYLSASSLKIYNNIKADNNNRPLLNTNNLYETIELLLAERKLLYEKTADYIIETDMKSPEQISYEIKRIWEAYIDKNSGY